MKNVTENTKQIRFYFKYGDEYKRWFLFKKYNPFYWKFCNWKYVDKTRYTYNILYWINFI